MIEKRKITKKIKKYNKNDTIISIMNGGSMRGPKPINGITKGITKGIRRTRSFSGMTPFMIKSSGKPSLKNTTGNTAQAPATRPLTSGNPSHKTIEGAPNTGASKTAAEAVKAAQTAAEAAQKTAEAVLKSLETTKKISEAQQKKADEEKQKAAEEAKKKEIESEKKKKENAAAISEARLKVDEQKSLLAASTKDVTSIQSMLSTIVTEAGKSTVSVDDTIAKVSAGVPESVKAVVQSTDFKNLLTSVKVTETALGMASANTRTKLTRKQQEIKNLVKSKEENTSNFVEKTKQLKDELAAISEKQKSQGQQQKQTSTIGWFKKTIFKSLGFKEMSVANQKYIQGKLNNLNKNFNRKQNILNKQIKNAMKKGKGYEGRLKDLEVQKKELQNNIQSGITDIFKEFTEKAQTDVADAKASMEKSADQLRSLESMQRAQNFESLIKSMFPQTPTSTEA